MVRSQEALAELKRSRDNLGQRITFYTDTSKIYDQGGLVKVTVPSFEGKGEYSFYMEGICFKRASHPYTDERSRLLLRNAFSFEPDKCCERVRHFKHYGRFVEDVQLPKKFRIAGISTSDQPSAYDRKGKDMLIDHHVLLGIRLVREVCYRKGLILVASPAIHADKATVGFTETLSRVYQKFKVETDEHQRENDEFKIAPLSKTMKNYMIALLIGYRNVTPGWVQSF